MWGAIVGDVIGSVYEFDNTKDYDFEMFARGSRFTDDTVMTVAVAEAVTKYLVGGRKEDLSALATDCMFRLGNEFHNVAWGARFRRWLRDPQPYDSLGNGSAMRISSVGWLARSEEEVKEFSRAVTIVSHGHPEGIKGAEAVAMATYLARNGASVEDIRKRMTTDYYPEIPDLSYDMLNKEYDWIWRCMNGVTCQASVPQAIVCFLEGRDYEDAIRKSVSIGGDSDTIASMAGAIAEAYYGLPESFVRKAKECLPKKMLEIIGYVEENGYKGKIIK